jgi:hypothetical protein
MSGAGAGDSGLMAEDLGDLPCLMLYVPRDLDRELADLVGMLADLADQCRESGELAFLALGVVRSLQGDDGRAARHVPYLLGGLAQLLGLLALLGRLAMNAAKD